MIETRFDQGQLWWNNFDFGKNGWWT